MKLQRLGPKSERWRLQASKDNVGICRPEKKMLTSVGQKKNIGAFKPEDIGTFKPEKGAEKRKMVIAEKKRWWKI